MAEKCKRNFIEFVFSGGSGLILSGKHRFNGLVCWLCTDELIRVSFFSAANI
jgi:hypothetical protein